MRKSHLHSVIAFFLLSGSHAHSGSVPGAHPFEKSFHRLFSIQRNLNKNEVVYEAKVIPEGFDVGAPIHVYWIVHTKGGRTEALTALERSRAYGVEIQDASIDEVVFVVRALRDQRITVHRTQGMDIKIFATTAINGRESQIERIFIQTEGSGLIPSVLYTELFGKTVAEGATISERISEK